MKSVLFQWGPLTIYSYGASLVMAFVLGLLMVVHRASKVGIDKQTVYDLGIWVIIGGLIGGRIAYVLFHFKEFSDNLLEIIMIQKGGLAFYGGFIGGLIVLWFILKRKKIPFLKMLDVMIPAIVLGHAIGRIGCFMNGCCYGKLTRCPLAVNFPSDSLASYHFGPNHLVHPTQVYEMILLVFVFILLLWIDRRKKFEGQTFFSYLIFYSIIRFFMEFIRADNPYIGPLTVYQMISLGMFGLGGFFYIKYWKNARRNYC